MTDSRAHDILSRPSDLETERSAYETVWGKVAEFCTLMLLTSGAVAARLFPGVTARQSGRSVGPRVSMPTQSTAQPTASLLAWRAFRFFGCGALI